MTTITDTTDNPAPDWTDQVDAALAAVGNAVAPTFASQLAPSPALEGMLKQGEALRLTPYRLGDGGATLGYGRYFPDGGTSPPAGIDQAIADAWFADDIEARAARWVRAYVTAPIVQTQFDALCSMAYNLRPASFRTIADAVNVGNDPGDAAMQFIRAGTNLENGLRNRRARELDLYRNGVYA